MAGSQTQAATPDHLNAPIMSALIGILAIALMVAVLVIAAGSLLIAGTFPIAKLLERWRARNSA